MARVLVIDDQPAIRNEIVRGLRKRFADAEVAEAANETTALAAIRIGHWDLVVLNLLAEGRSEQTVLRAIEAVSPAVPVLTNLSRNGGRFVGVCPTAA